MSGLKFNLDDHFLYDKSTDKSTCLACRNVFNKRIPGNLKRHYFTQHPMEAAAYEDFMKPHKIQKFDRTDKRNQFLINMVKLVTKRFVSLNFFDWEEISQILEPWSDILDINIDCHLIREVINYAAKVVRIQIAEELKNSMIALKFDIATKLGRSILSINVQFIESGKIVARNLATHQFNVTHTNDQIKKEIFKVLESYGIGIGQVISSTIDNAVNSIKISELSNDVQLGVEETPPDTEFEGSGLNLNSSERFPIVQPVAQTFNLFVTDFLKIPIINEKLELCRLVARKARTPINRRFFIRSEIPIPILDVSSRWSSTFAMVSFMRIFKEIIIKFIESIEPSIQNFDWQFVVDFVECMDVINIVFKNLQSHQLVPGDVYKNWLNIEIDLKALVGKNPFASEMLELMNVRKPGLFEAPVFKAGLFLDPRFNYLNSKHISASDKEVGRDFLLKVFKNLKDQGFYENVLEIESSTTKPMSKLEAFLNETDTGITDKSVTLPMLQDLNNLANGIRQHSDTNILSYYENCQNGALKAVASAVLAVSPTQASMERNTSVIGQSLTSRGTAIDPGLLDDILLLNVNEELLNLIEIPWPLPKVKMEM